MIRIFAVTGALFGAMSVGMGAFGAHALRKKVLDGSLEPRLLEVWETAAHYQVVHALALLAVAWLAGQQPQGATTTAGIAFIAGTLLFSGSLYTMTLTGMKWLGAITPLGGTAFIVGWLALAVACFKTL